ncbi:hypothetical protein MB02_13205 [Croceicoccus estronivorus]|uniref:hypothetical protein n=1 Tax=Croceicoccus estronivorus TaxID=1172626 RepID=UPI00082E5B8C|nr:hypothetical protein [Croceicoccus estronivorus]OCC23122.1 hypothetical protein MB02_13205 [Croceicoccus estronivorus]
MRFIPAALAVLALVPVSTAFARDQDEPPEKPVTDDTVTAGDVAKTPLSDLNLSNDEIPELLVQARTDPYDTVGLSRCSAIIGAVSDLDAILGEDLDTAEARGRSLDPGRVAQWAVGTFIPFRGLIRELSGAKAHERKFQDAIVAGMMRRAYLKGIGQQKGCRYPGRPARDDEVEAIKAKMEADRKAAEQAEKLRKKNEKQARKANRNRDEAQLVSRPVVQTFD